MLGGGNPVGGANPVGVGKTLQYVGDMAYAYSGEIGVNNAEVTLLEFETGTQSIVGRLAIQNGSGSGDDMRYTVQLNGETVALIYSGSSDDWVSHNPIDIILTAFTNVKIFAENISSGNLRPHTAIITGKII